MLIFSDPSTHHHSDLRVVRVILSVRVVVVVIDEGVFVSRGVEVIEPLSKIRN